jgi:hypothetical protein
MRKVWYGLRTEGAINDKMPKYIPCRRMTWTNTTRAARSSKLQGEICITNAREKLDVYLWSTLGDGTLDYPAWVQSNNTWIVDPKKTIDALGFLRSATHAPTTPRRRQFARHSQQKHIVQSCIAAKSARGD